MVMPQKPPLDPYTWDCLSGVMMNYVSDVDRVTTNSNNESKNVTPNTLQNNFLAIKLLIMLWEGLASH
jgi:hypothetical protein